MTTLDLGTALTTICAPGASALCVEASAGTGKTWTLERLVLGLAVRKAVPIQRILVLTYTEAASQELKDRIRARLLELAEGGKEAAELTGLLGIQGLGSDQVAARVRKALADFDQAPIGTIHGFCTRLIRDFHFELGLPAPVVDLEAAGEGKAALLSAILTRRLYGLAPDTVSTMMADCVLEEFSRARTGDDAMEELTRVLGSWLDRGFADPLAFRVDTAAWASLSALVRAPEFGAGLGAALEPVATLGTTLRDRLGLRDYPEGGAERWKSLGFDAQYGPAFVRRWEEVVTWAGQGRQGLGLYQDMPAMADLAAFAKVWTGERTGRRALKVEVLLAQPWVDQSMVGRFITAVEDLVREVDALDRQVYGCLGLDLPAGSGKNSPVRLVGKVLAAAFFHEVAAELDQGIQDLRHREGLVDYSAMIDLVYRGVSAVDPAFRTLASVRYDALLVDEFQDTDAKQWAIFTTLFAAKTLVVVGDPKQAIYAFRGADVGVYRAAVASLEREATGAMSRLDTNHRSVRGVVEAGNFLFAHAREGLGFPDFQGVAWSEKKMAELASSYGTGPDPAAVLVPLPLHLALRHWTLWMAQEIKGLLGGRAGHRLGPGDITVLTARNRDGAYVLRTLGRLGIPARQAGKGSLGLSAQADTLVLACDALARPDSPRALRAFALSGLGGLDPASLDGKLAVLGLVVAEARRVSQTRGIMAAFEVLLAPREADLAVLPEGRRILTDLRLLVELLAQRLSDGRREVSRLGLEARRLVRDLQDKEEHSLHLDRQEAAVTIMTMHSSKGLEFPVVFLVPNLSSKTKTPRLPAIMQEEDGRTLSWTGHSDQRAAMDASAREASLALWYVALTRASLRHYIPLASKEPEAIGSDPRSALGLLLDLTEGTGPAQVGAVPPVSPGDLARFLELYRIQYGPTELPGPAVTEDAIPKADPVLPGPALLVQSLADHPPAARFPVRSSYSELSGHLLGKGSHGSPGSGRTRAIAAMERTGGDSAEGTSSEGLSTGTGSTDRLPAGTAFGQVVHDIFEVWDFQDLARICKGGGDQDGFGRFLSQSLRKNGFSPAKDLAWKDELLAMVGGVLDTALPLGSGPTPLGTLPAPRLRKEQGFTFHLSSMARGRKPVIRDLALLGAIGLGDRTELEVPAEYLNGVIDLVILDGVRLHVLDWKTNRLGAYDTETMATAMDDHLYRLQALVYLAALRKGFPGTEPGEAWYVFTRGPGVYHCTFSPGLVEGFLAGLEGGD